MKKILSLAVVVIVVLSVMTGCAAKSNLTLSVTSPDATVFEKNIAFELKDTTTAAEATKSILDKNKISYQETDGFFTSFGNVESTDTDGWLLYINDTLAEKGAAEIIVAANDKISWKFENYEEVFGSFSDESSESSSAVSSESSSEAANSGTSSEAVDEK